MALGDQQYWASVDTKDLGPKLDEKIKDYYSSLIATGRVDVWRRSFRMLYGWDPQGSYKSSRHITFSGEEGENVNASANLIRAFTRAMHTQITGSRPSYQCRSTADDAQATETVQLGNALLDYYWTEARIEDAASTMAWYALPAGEGWMYLRWDHYAGNALGVNPDTGGLLWSGDIAATPLKPEDVIRDVSRTDGDHEWLIVSTLHSRWNLAARFPQYADVCLNATPPQQWTTIRSRLPSSQMWREGATDVIPIFELWHKKTDALPSGRHAMMIGDVVVIDEPMEYSILPVVDMIPNMEVDSPYGYGETWDLNNLQQALNSVITQVVSTRENFGARNIWSMPGVKLSPIQLGQGFRVIESQQKPEVIDMGEGYVQEGQAAVDFIKALMQIQTGLNDTVLGDASKSQSGAALAMLHSMAMQFNSGLQRAYASASERFMGLVIESVRLYMQGERMIPIVGRGNRQSIKRFQAQDLANIQSVQVEMGAAIMRTAAGRREIADKLLEAQFVDREEYLEMQSTGRLEPAFKRPMSQRVLIDTENERLMDPARAATVRVMATDDHALHIREHTIVMNDPDVRMDDATFAVASQHILEHSNQWQQLTQMNPAILAATGQRPAPMPPPPPMMGPPGAGPTGPMPGPNAGPPSPNPGGSGGAPAPAEAAPANDTAPPSDAGAAPNMPKMPAEATAGV